MISTEPEKTPGINDSTATQPPATSNSVTARPHIIDNPNRTATEDATIKEPIEKPVHHGTSLNSSSEQSTHEEYERGGDYGGDGDLEAVQSSASTAPHSVFSPAKKRFIVFMTVCTGIISPLSATIYFPALNVLAKDLHVSNSLINLTLTSFMIFQGLAPTIFGDFADMAGRRPAYVISFIIYIGACTGIALQNSFAALFVLRCLQSSGSSGTIALSNGIVADISTSVERGAYMGWVTSGFLLGPAIGPILGGVLSQFLGWRAIFWFLIILVAVILIPFLIAFPETGRNVVGNGSIPPRGWNMSLLNYLELRKASKAAPDTLTRTLSRDSARAAQATLRKKRRLRFPNPLHTLKVVTEKDMGLLLMYNSIVYSAFYDINASTPYLFQRLYGFNELQIGLSYIPFGVGCLVAPLINGRVLDWNFRRVAKQQGIALDKKRMTDLRGFPLEKARVHVAWPLLVVGLMAMVVYGWVMQYRAPLGVALVLQLVMGLCLTGSFGVMSVMLVDNYPLSPATATAGNNLVRCLMGAGATAVIIEMIDAMGTGWCFTLIAGIVACTSPILWILLRWGPKWRREREDRTDARLAAEEEKSDEEERAEAAGREKESERRLADKDTAA